MIKSSKRTPFNYFRISIQWLILILLIYLLVRPFFDKSYTADFEAYCPFGGMQALSSYFANNSLACSMTTLQIAMGLALVLGILLLGKLFCSYICPIGTFTEWFGKAGRRFKINFTLTGYTDRALRILKYALLFLTFYFTVSSSELFCRKFDPYYAIFSGFSADVVILYAAIALFVVIAGSIFIRQFWCKYLCPLGAVTNIFVNFIAFTIITGIYLLFILVFRLTIGWAWYLATVCFCGFLLESIRMKGWIFPPVKITRNDETCTHCRRCDKACPMAISVSQTDKVNHLDCHLCGDCITACHEKDGLTINHRRWQWLPPVAVIILIALAIIISSSHEVPTISLRWGTPAQLGKAAVYQQSGLKNIKCFGSSTSFAEQMKDVKGVLGVETFVKHHSVKIFFDPLQTNASEIKKAIFTPVATILKEPGQNIRQLSVVELRINNFFDANDEFFLNTRLSQNQAIFGIETEFGEPVLARIYFNPSAMNLSGIHKLIEAPEAIYTIENTNITEKTNFRIAKGNLAVSTLPVEEFYRRMFKPFDESFNNYDSYPSGEVAVYGITFPEVIYPDKAHWLPYLESHLSNDEGIVRFQTLMEGNVAMLKVYFVKAKTNENNIRKALNAPKLTVFYPGGETKQYDNPYHFN
jgi:Pyruvate/2-oxoacid:ferredoxin oxidoreductase delta subunit